MKGYKKLIEKFDKEKINKLEDKIQEKFSNFSFGSSLMTTSSKLMEEYYIFRKNYLNKLIRRTIK